jgi:hypothetical protein
MMRPRKWVWAAFDQLVRYYRIAGDDDGTVRGIEAVCERWRYQGVVDYSSRHGHVLIVHDLTTSIHFMHVNQRLQWCSAFVRDPSGHVMCRIVASGTPASTSCRATPSPQSTT